MWHWPSFWMLSLWNQVKLLEHACDISKRGCCHLWLSYRWQTCVSQLWIQDCRILCRANEDMVWWCLMSHVLDTQQNENILVMIHVWCVKGWPRFWQDCVQDSIACPLMRCTRKPSTLCWGMSLWSGCFRNMLVAWIPCIFDWSATDWSDIEADTMADGRRLAFEDSRKLGVTCKATLRKKTNHHESPITPGKEISTKTFFCCWPSPWGGDNCGGGHCKEWKPFGENLREKHRGTWWNCSRNPRWLRWTPKPLKQVQLDLTCQRWRSGIACACAKNGPHVMLVSGSMLPFFVLRFFLQSLVMYRQFITEVAIVLKGHQSSNGRDWSTSSWAPELHWWCPLLDQSLASFGFQDSLPRLCPWCRHCAWAQPRKEQWKQC